MMLWVLERKDSVGYEEHIGAVVRAEDEAEARRICDEKLTPRGEGAPWLSAKTCSCVPLLNLGEPGVILDSFNAG